MIFVYIIVVSYAHGLLYFGSISSEIRNVTSLDMTRSQMIHICLRWHLWFANDVLCLGDIHSHDSVSLGLEYSFLLLSSY